MKDKYELEYSFICLDWAKTNEEIIGYNWYKPKKVTVYTVTDYYYDIGDRLLQKQKYVFRKRLSTKNSSIIYTLKGPTQVIDGVPGRLEIESEDYDKIMSKLYSELDLDNHISNNLEVVQLRMTSRTEVKFNGYTMFIDKTVYENGAEYFNIELENYDNLDAMKGFAKTLEGKIGIYPTLYSKFQIGEIIKKLGIEKGRINSNKYMQILGYERNK